MSHHLVCLSSPAAGQVRHKYLDAEMLSVPDRRKEDEDEEEEEEEDEEEEEEANMVQLRVVVLGCEYLLCFSPTSVCLV